MRHPVSSCRRAERRAAPEPARASRETRLALRLFTPGEGLGLLAQRGLQGRPMYSSDEGRT